MNKQPQWFKDWLGNDWKHLTWKVNGLIAGMILTIGLLSAILTAAVSKLFG